LSDNGLVNKAKRKPKKNPTKPRFFERSRPNQLWQSDIMTFRLAGCNAYAQGAGPERFRAEMIMKLRCGLLTDRQAADRMGVSRKTFYKWEKRGLNALLDNVTDLPPVRRAHPLDDRILDLEKQLALAHREIDLLNCVC
jgi:predicted DNA-binding transcriptional regulator AlpA